VIHTAQVQAGIYHRNDPQYSEQLEAVEVWRKADPTTVLVDVWVYDPMNLEEPWYVQQTYKQVRTRTARCASATGTAAKIRTTQS